MVNNYHYVEELVNICAEFFVSKNYHFYSIYLALKFRLLNSKVESLMFQLLVECHCRCNRESRRAHVAKFYGRLRLIRSVLRASNLSA